MTHDDVGEEKSVGPNDEIRTSKTEEQEGRQEASNSLVPRWKSSQNHSSGLILGPESALA